MLLTPAQINQTRLNRHGTLFIYFLFLFFTQGVCVSCLRAWLGAQYPNLSEGADRVGGQLHGDKECPVFSGVIVQELYESRGGRPGLSVLTSLLVSVDVKNY